jgi:diguanylate cyclase
MSWICRNNPLSHKCNINQGKFSFVNSIFSIVLLLFSFIVPAQNIEKNIENNLANQQQIKLTDDNNIYSFANKLVYFEDKTGQLAFKDIRRNNNFKLMTKDNISLGYIESTLWLKFNVKNQAKNKQNWRLLFDYPLLDELVIYQQQKDKSWQETHLGDKLPFAQRELEHRIFVNTLNLNTSTPTQFFVKIKTTSSMQVRPSISSTEQFFINELHNEMFYGLIYGVMLLMAMYNIFLYFAVKDTAYLAYVFSVLSGCIFIMALNGHAYQYLWPNSPNIANTAVPLTPAIWMVFTAIFTQMFLETKRFAPRLYNAMNLQMGLATFSIIFSLFGPYQLAIKIATLLALTNGILILVTSIVCWQNGNRFARYFVGAWAVYGMGTAMLIISRFGLLPDNFVTHNSAALGLLVEIIMLSLALSDKYRVLTYELEQHAHELEEKVTLRTKELELSNQQLIELSRSDALTGLANRRHLDQQLEHEWALAYRNQTPLSILVADIDQFKNINDHFGHQYGDECILEVARILTQQTPAISGLPARFGGDEFVVILPNTLNEEALSLAEDICSRLEQRKIAQAPNTLYNVVTLSIGCATITPNKTNDIKRLFSLADKNLYQAKKMGRNGVSSSHDFV